MSTEIDTARAGALLDEAPLTNATLFRFAPAGSVDDGKSTLVGRLLYDTKSVLADQLDAVERVSRERWVHFRKFLPRRGDPVGTTDRDLINAEIDKAVALESDL